MSQHDFCDMVLSRRLEYGFNGYQVPSMPRAARSARRRSSARNNAEDPKLCAFDLLATLAGNLLVGNSSSASTSNSSTQNGNCVINDLNGEEGYVDQSDHSEPQPDDRSSTEKEIINSLIILPDIDEGKSNPSGIDIHASAGDVSIKLGDTADTKDQSEGLGADMLSCEQGNTDSERVGDFVRNGPSVLPKVKDETHGQMKVESHISDGADVYSLKDHVTSDKKPLARHSSNNSSRLDPCENKDQLSLSSFPVENGVVVVSRDNDDNSSGCTHPSSYTKPFRPVPYIGDRRIRKVLASQSCKAIPRYKSKFLRPGGGPYQAHFLDSDRWLNYQGIQSQRNFPFKKRKFYDMDCRSISDKETNGKGGDNISTSRKSLKEDCSEPERFTSLAVPRSTFPDVDSHVKLRIESFRVPEMLIEIPETATVGSLKRAVVDAVTTILGGGLHVGVLLQGQKVGDDSKTLQQTGISHDRALDALGFMLEPDPAHYPPPISPGSSSLLRHCDAPQPLTRYHAAPTKVQPGNCDKLAEPRGAHSRKLVESDRDSTTSPVNMLRKGRAESKALVPIPSMNTGAKAAVAIHRKSKRSEIAQRRIRRPFTVAEVEALVQAVEKLGTGRWRDVKLHAFDSARHRTYVDLKDKWKTLVHTAKISPQQRRGEPVPQELLDRVLTAHAYWGQQQSRPQQLKQLLY
ncbi:hypothetical protein MLD38_009650 [Melastoma candidum]|uniref:Uncharacterized protein n=1 Tax=Melastoma candidum TaxID=119954 RepID=A0ACB9S1X7_9MYRT|nr:hypothetical protein MLD38_009650 [Melastoma candidum]